MLRLIAIVIEHSAMSQLILEYAGIKQLPIGATIHHFIEILILFVGSPSIRERLRRTSDWVGNVSSRVSHCSLLSSITWNAVSHLFVGFVAVFFAAIIFLYVFAIYTSIRQPECKCKLKHQFVVR